MKGELIARSYVLFLCFVFLTSLTCSTIAIDCSDSSSDVSTDYIFAIPYFPDVLEIRLEVVFISNDAASATISLINEVIDTINIEIPVGEISTAYVHTVDLTSARLLPASPGQWDAAFCLSSNANISVVVKASGTDSSAHFSCSSSMFPLDSLATHYTVVTHCDDNYCFLLIVSLNNDLVTKVSVDLEMVEIGGSPAQVVYGSQTYTTSGSIRSFTEYLQAFHTMYIRADYIDISGSRVTSDQKIAVFGGGFQLEDTKGLTFDQIPPTVMLNTTYIVASMQEELNADTMVKVVFTESDTVLNTSTLREISFESSFAWYFLPHGEAAHLEASNPVLVIISCAYENGKVYSMASTILLPEHAWSAFSYTTLVAIKSDAKSVMITLYTFTECVVSINDDVVTFQDRGTFYLYHGDYPGVNTVCLIEAETSCNFGGFISQHDSGKSYANVLLPSSFVPRHQEDTTTSIPATTTDQHTTEVTSAEPQTTTSETETTTDELTTTEETVTTTTQLQTGVKETSTSQIVTIFDQSETYVEGLENTNSSDPILENTTYVDELSENTTYVDELSENTTYIDELSENTTYVDELSENTTYVDELSENTTYVDELSENTTYVDELSENTTYVDELSENTTYVDELSENTTSTYETTSEKPHFVIGTGYTNLVTCPCKCPQTISNMTMTEAEVVEWQEEMQEILELNISSLSSTVRSKTSATSVKDGGTFAASLLAVCIYTITFGFMILVDCLTLFSWLFRRFLTRVVIRGDIEDIVPSTAQTPTN